MECQDGIRQRLADIYQHCESRRQERILWIDLDLSIEPYSVEVGNFSITEFIEIVIETNNELHEESITLECLKLLCNTLSLDELAKGTILQINNRRDFSFVAEIDMDVNTFLENF